jgi:hypothetical protein
VHDIVGNVRPRLGFDQARAALTVSTAERWTLQVFATIQLFEIVG